MKNELNLDMVLTLIASFQNLENIFKNVQNIFSDNSNLHFSALKESRDKQKDLLKILDCIIQKSEANPDLKLNNLSN